MGDSQTMSSSASGATIDWTAAFQSPEFLSGLQAAIAGVTTSNPRPEQLEQLGDSIPSQPSTSGMSAAGNLPAAQGTFHAPSFVSTVNGSVPEPSCPLNPSQQAVNELNPTSVTSLASSFPAPNVGLGLEKAFSLGPGRFPIPPKLVAKILSYKFVDLTELGTRIWTIPSRTLLVLLLKIQPSCPYSARLRVNVSPTWTFCHACLLQNFLIY